MNVRRVRKPSGGEVVEEGASRKSVQPHTARSVVDINWPMAFQWPIC